jgi:anti-sigma B factor antagonist
MRAERPVPHRPFAISIVHDEDEVAVVPVGELDLATSGKLEQEVRRVQTAGAARILLDLREVDFIDSTGLRMLLSLRNDAARNGHALTLAPPGPAGMRVLELTGTRGLFDWRP